MRPETLQSLADARKVCSAASELSAGPAEEGEVGAVVHLGEGDLDR